MGSAGLVCAGAVAFAFGAMEAAAVLAALAAPGVAAGGLMNLLFGGIWDAAVAVAQHWNWLVLTFWLENSRLLLALGLPFFSWLELALVEPASIAILCMLLWCWLWLFLLVELYCLLLLLRLWLLVLLVVVWGWVVLVWVLGHSMGHLGSAVLVESILLVHSKAFRSMLSLKFSIICQNGKPPRVAGSVVGT